ncbi:MAG: outer membrane beta-barrel protein [Ignavibacteriae bacterium]|nr:outer membrane beta-barrel protein [Ignavibacteriota bacterium]
MQTFRVLSRIAVVLVVCAVVGGQASAQLPSVSLSLTGGLALPMGDFGSTENNIESGFASTGWNAGANVDISVIPMFTVVASFTYASNSVSEDIMGGAQYSGDLGSWTTMWPMVGLKYSLGVGPIATIYFTGQGGVALGNTPEVDITVNGTPIKAESISGSGFAFGLGAGVQLAGKFVVEVRLLSANPEYESNGQTMKQSTSIVQLNAGISL